MVQELPDDEFVMQFSLDLILGCDYGCRVRRVFANRDFLKFCDSRKAERIWLVRRSAKTRERYPVLGFFVYELPAEERSAMRTQLSKR